MKTGGGSSRGGAKQQSSKVFKNSLPGYLLKNFAALLLCAFARKSYPLLCGLKIRFGLILCAFARKSYPLLCGLKIRSGLILSAFA